MFFSDLVRFLWKFIKWYVWLSTGGQRRIHGTRGGVFVRGLGGDPLRQAMRSVVAGRHRLYTAVRVSAVPRRLRFGLWMGTRGELSRLPGSSLHFHTGKGLDTYNGRTVFPNFFCSISNFSHVEEF